ncbi:ATP synthase subunit O, mitochondrial-like [Saccoglossus kowalevskii]|uniref:ATP synthase peripheral stalk subunit OSCP, mitochondrial n=1 Tax=Saccoglossus kowalevskii TaxID=10224 RepID=A0ABM0GIN1_SACKO|nr:PREDICTED: ATP synthase subunit O, mitochondrial-like [Saccoglossus kowalevskii]
MAASRSLILARCFSTSVAKAQMVKPPIQIYGIGGRYAHALYSAASKEKKLDQIETDLKTVKKLLDSDKKFAEFVRDPTLNKRIKKEALTGVLQKQNCQQVTVNLFELLAENGRLKKITEVLNAFGRIMSAHRGEVVCVVTTSQALDDKELKSLQEAIKSFLKKGESLKLDVQVDPKILGGMVVNIGDKYVDMSTATKIRKFTELLRDPVEV